MFRLDSPGPLLVKLVPSLELAIAVEFHAGGIVHSFESMLRPHLKVAH